MSGSSGSDEHDQSVSPDLSVTELAELEAGTGGALSPLLSRADVGANAAICLAAAALAIYMPDLVISGGIFISRDYSTMSPSLIPRLAFALLALVAAISAFAAYRRLKTLDAAPAGDEVERFGRAALTLAIIVFYAATVTWLGFILSTMIVAAVTAFFLGLRNPLAFVPMVLVVPVTIRFVFERLLLISLPRSSIESVGHVEDVLMRFLVDMILA